MRSWSSDSIREALDIKQREGRCVVTLPSPNDARLFRSAIYNYCRKNKLPTITISVSGCDVILEPKRIYSYPLAMTSESSI